MHLNHVALWTNNPERLKEFYTKFFGCKSSDRYVNHQKGFSSYFITFEGGPRLEIMSRSDITEIQDKERIGFAHIAIGVGTIDDVNNLTEEFKKAGIIVSGNPRLTGDGCYESVILDPDNNRIELIADL